MKKIRRPSGETAGSASLNPVPEKGATRGADHPRAVRVALRITNGMTKTFGALTVQYTVRPSGLNVVENSLSPVETIPSAKSTGIVSREPDWAPAPLAQTTASHATAYRAVMAAHDTIGRGTVCQSTVGNRSGGCVPHKLTFIPAAGTST